MESNLLDQNNFADSMQNQEKKNEGTLSDEKNTTINIKGDKIVEWCCYIIGAIFIIISFSLMNKDLDYRDNPFRFYEKSYVGGDAYNYIISAARSSAVMVKSLIWMVAGCSTLIIGRITALISNKNGD